MASAVRSERRRSSSSSRVGPSTYSVSRIVEARSGSRRRVGGSGSWDTGGWLPPREPSHARLDGITIARSMRLFLAVLVLLVLASPAAGASLPSVASGHRPGPDAL